MHLHSLHIYPVKSCAGVDVNHVSLEAEGFTGDRRWMVVDMTGQFITQRSHPVMARLSAHINQDGLTLTFEGETIDVPYPQEQRTDVVVWGDTVNATLCGKTVNDWMSDRLGDAVQLVHMHRHGLRMRAAFEQDSNMPVSFADGYPVLITQTASLAALNRYIAKRSDIENKAPLTLSRFRPNIVIEGGEAWAMDGWANVQIGDIVFDLIKPCTRCVMTTLDPNTGESRGPAALDALKALRMSGDKRVKGVLFGWNAVARNLGSLSVGDTVSVLETRKPWPIRSF